MFQQRDAKLGFGSSSDAVDPRDRLSTVGPSSGGSALSGLILQPGAPAAGYVWAVLGVAAATAAFWLIRHTLDKGQASLLYLPVVIACAIRFGFGPAIAGAVLSFLCWDFFFLPPFYTFRIAATGDWLSLVIFLTAAATTSRLASRARREAQEARARERETRTLYQASLAVNEELDAARILPKLAEQVVETCRASRCVVLRHIAGQSPSLIIAAESAAQPLASELREQVARIAGFSQEQKERFGLAQTERYWRRALLESSELPAPGEDGFGIYIPLQFQGAPVGVLHVGPLVGGGSFSAAAERIILTLANNAAVVFTRQAFADEAAQAAALREADLLKDSLLSMVSHELRTPLAAIKAVASGLRQQDAAWTEGERAEAMLSIDTEADRLSVLVNNLLDFSRLEAGAWQPRKDWCDVGEIVGTALARMSAEEAARVRLAIPPELPLVWADYVQIEAVAANLLQNALKYSPQDQPVTVECAEDSAPSRSVRVTVRDFGEGIMPEEAASLFDRFYRGVRHRRSTVHGSGLGLALCRAIVNAHGGAIWAANAPAGQPRGAVFAFTLPCDRE